MLAKFLAKLKALPLAAKIVLGIFLLLFCYGASQHHPPYNRGGSSDGGGSFGGDGGSYGGNDNSSQVEQLKAQENRLIQLAQQCEVQMSQNQAQWARDAANGVMPTSQAPCEAQMPTWIAQAKGIESQLQRLQGGGGGGSYGGGSQGGSAYGGGAQGGYAYSGGAQPNYYHPTDPNAPSYNHPDTSTDAVDKWDRNYIRGTSNYTDESGEVHELETQPYYSQDNQTGQYVGSTDNTVPNDTHTYTPLTNNDDPQ